eukprot:1577432-Karenia_brevis.AAC.1
MHLQFSPRLTSAVLALPDTKSGNRYNFTESVTISDLHLVRKLHGFLVDLAPGDFLFQGSGPQFRSEFDKHSQRSCYRGFPPTWLFKSHNNQRQMAK